MPRAASDDLILLAARLRLGIPLSGLDGREIPLRDLTGRELDAIDAAHELLRSGASLLPTDDAGRFIDEATDRARRVEAASVIAGEGPDDITAKVTGVLVSAAIRATVLACSRNASPTDLNRATLSWFQAHDLLRRQMLVADSARVTQRLSA